LTGSTSGSRQEPGTVGGTFTAESNNLTIDPNSVCSFGGDDPGIQFLESNPPGATAAPACPALTATATVPNQVPSNESCVDISVSGRLVGQQSNWVGPDLEPDSCSVSGPLAASQYAGVPGQVFCFQVPSSAAPGSSFSESATCDTGQQVNFPITVPAYRCCAADPSSFDCIPTKTTSTVIDPGPPVCASGQVPVSSNGPTQCGPVGPAPSCAQSCTTTLQYECDDCPPPRAWCPFTGTCIGVAQCKCTGPKCCKGSSCK